LFKGVTSPYTIVPGRGGDCGFERGVRFGEAQLTREKAIAEVVNVRKKARLERLFILVESV
jgi:hypothetical protein